MAVSAGRSAATRVLFVLALLCASGSTDGRRTKHSAKAKERLARERIVKQLTNISREAKLKVRQWRPRALTTFLSSARRPHAPSAYRQRTSQLACLSSLVMRSCVPVSG